MNLCSVRVVVVVVVVVSIGATVAPVHNIVRSSCVSPRGRVNARVRPRQLGASVDSSSTVDVDRDEGNGIAAAPREMGARATDGRAASSRRVVPYVLEAAL